MKRFCGAALMIGCLTSPVHADLEAYVNKPDETYKWQKRAEFEALGVECAELRMVSQTWHGITWKHRMFVARPKTMDTESQALLVIGGGSWRDRYDTPPSADARPPGMFTKYVVPIAHLARMPVAMVSQVPFQPMFGGKKEDAIISLTFQKFLETKESDWPLLLPMTKSAVRAMDTVQAYAKQEWSVDIRNFTVTGASKRGWTTWLTGAADPRVNSIAPMVIDTLNMGPQMRHQLETWGTYSEEIADYTERGIQDQMNSPLGKKLTAVVDPYSYRKALTMPKLIMIGTNDRYWPLDALNLYWDDLEGENNILYVPNKGHGLDDLTRVVGGATGLARMAAGKAEFPELKWDLTECEKALTLEVKSAKPPTKVSAWIATSPTRDFREAEWKQHELQPGKAGAFLRDPATGTDQPITLETSTYTHVLQRPAAGCAAMFGEVVHGLGGHNVFRSTNVKVIQALPGWTTLFDGKSFDGWHAGSPGAEHAWQVAGGVRLDPADNRKLLPGKGETILVNGPTGRTKDLHTELEHGDCELHLEFLVAERSNSGVYFMGRYEVQILDSYGETELGSGDCGGIYARWIDEKSVDGRPPDYNASKRPGLWQSYDVIFRAPKFDASGKKIANAKFEKVIHNSVVVHESVDLKGPTRGGIGGPEKPKGALRLQGDHGPVAYRNIRIKHLD